jgi:hypothetical protein
MGWFTRNCEILDSHSDVAETQAVTNVIWSNVKQLHTFRNFAKYLPGDNVSHPKRLESSVQGILSLEVKDRKVTTTSSNFNGEE